MFQKLWSFLDALPRDGGPSSTRFIYLMSGATVSFCLVVMALSFSWVYVRSHVADIVMAGAVAGAIAALIGFATNAQNKRNELSADCSKAETKGD